MAAGRPAWRRRGIGFVAAGALIMAPGDGISARHSPVPPPFRSPQSIADALAAARAARIAVLPAPVAGDLAAFYAVNPESPAWLDAARRPTPAARAGVELLGRADEHGLVLSSYDAIHLAAVAAAFERAPAATIEDAARFDVALSAALLRYCRHLHDGRIDPRTFGLRLTGHGDGHDFAAILRAARDAGRLAEAARDLAPPLGQYRQLQVQLAHYRALALAESEADLPRAGQTLRPGDPSPDLDVLHRRLVALGDLPAGTPPPGNVYDTPLQEAVRRFQERHGLEADAIVGRATMAALRVPLQWRVRQIELALERLRWLPDLRAGRTVAVNIPMFRLWAWDREPDGGRPALSMPVIVGSALDTRTPVLAERLDHVIFRPSWNVPASILRDEMLPILRRDPDYLSREDLEIVEGPGDNAAVLAPTPENIARLGRDGVRLRQRPGPRNALGLVKFMFPNDEAVYMHDTPAPQLFQRSRRDFSHGCIRVADPTALAEWVLAPDAAWTRDAIREAMQGEATRRVDLVDPVQVIIVYTTAVVDPVDGRIHFAHDLYGQDAPLDEALRRASPGADPAGVDVHEVR